MLERACVCICMGCGYLCGCMYVSLHSCEDNNGPYHIASGGCGLQLHLGPAVLCQEGSRSHTERQAYPCIKVHRYVVSGDPNLIKHTVTWP